MKRLRSGSLLFGAAAIASVALSCEQRSLVLIDVQPSLAFNTEPSRLLDVRLTITANRNLTTRFQTARLSTAAPYRIGVYLPAEMTGTVTFDGTIDDGNCVWGTGSAVAMGVNGGETTAPVPLPLDPTGSCVPIGGTGSAGAGGAGGNAGAGGMTGAAGVIGTAGSGPGGSGGPGGMTGVAGSGPGGTMGAAGRGGTTGTAGSGPGGTTGTAGTGAATGAAGRGGTTGAAGIGGMTGAAGRGGSTGTAGVGGMTGAAGRGGTTGSAGSGPAGTMGTAGRGGSVGTAGTGAIVGTAGTGGMVGTAGSGPGGIPGRGGTVGTAGSGGSGTGGTTCACSLPWVCHPTAGCVCQQSNFEACANAGIQCGYAYNACSEYIFCDCPIAGSFCEISTGRCMRTCTTGTAGIITTESTESLDIICPPQPD